VKQQLTQNIIDYVVNIYIMDLKDDIDKIKVRYNIIKQGMISTYPNYKLDGIDTYKKYENNLVKLFNDIEKLKITHKNSLNLDKNEFNKKSSYIQELKDIYKLSKKDIDNISNKYYASYSIIKLGLDNKLKIESKLMFLTLSLFFLINLLKRLITTDNI
tara:strand:+ start:559 stop:1035 length:477 start_codon:yes stop_codon:yes gene_type:complete